MKLPIGALASNLIFFILMNGLSQSALSDELYKWVDDRGRVTYQSSPPPENAAKIEKTKIGTNPVAINEDAKAGEKKEPNKVTFYSVEDCSSCDKVRTYFQKTGVPFEEIDLTDNKEKLQELDKKIGFNEAPIMQIGTKYLTGFDPKLIGTLLKKEGIQLPEE